MIPVHTVYGAKEVQLKIKAKHGNLVNTWREHMLEKESVISHNTGHLFAGSG